MRLRLGVAYDGTGFHGFSAQPGLRTVEGVLRDALEATYDRVDELRVAGRTDTGVHATDQVVGVEVAGGPPADRAARVISAHLPHDVAIHEALVASDTWHARHSARARAYLYRIRTTDIRDPLAARRELHHPQSLDGSLLDTLAGVLVGTHDFRAFTPTETEHHEFVRTVYRAEWTASATHREFLIVGDRFVRHQVRTVVGTMLQVARGERPAEMFASLLDGAPRRAGGATAPPHGLYLVGVGYEGDAVDMATWSRSLELAGMMQLCSPVGGVSS